MKKKYLLTTEDGTATLFLEEYEQAMHSMSGAYEESLLKHIIPSGILECEKDILNVLDVGFGLGYNVLALINEFLNKNDTRKLNIYSLEKDRNFMEFINSITFNDSRDNIYSFISETYLSGEGNLNGINLKILLMMPGNPLKIFMVQNFMPSFRIPFPPQKILNCGVLITLLN